MTWKLKAAIVIAYLPTVLLILTIALLLLAYLNDWRIWVHKIPIETPAPTLQVEIL